MAKVAPDVPQLILDTFNLVDYNRTKNVNELISKLKLFVNMPLVGFKTRTQIPSGTAKKSVAADVPQALLDVLNKIDYSKYSEKQIFKTNLNLQDLLISEQVTFKKL